MGIGDHRIWKLAANVRITDQVWVDSAQQSYRVLWIDDNDADGRLFWVLGNDGRPLALPPVDPADTVTLEVMT